MNTPTHSIKVVVHKIGGVTLGQTPELFLCSGFHSSVAAKEIVGSGEQSSPAQEYLASVESIPASCQIAVLYEHPDAQPLLGAVEAKAKAMSQIIIAPIGRRSVDNGEAISVAVATPSGVAFTDKISFSDDDVGAPSCSGKNTVMGRALHIFESDEIRLAVFNCHDYTHADLINALLVHKVDFLVVTSRNKATRLYEEYAVSDLHRLCCFVVINNVSDYGGTGVYAPFSRLGGQGGQITLGGSLFATRGPSEVSGFIPIPLGELRRLRTSFEKNGVEAAISYQAIDPPEHIKCAPRAPSFRQNALSREVESVRLADWGYQRNRQGPVRVAVAQMRSLGMQDYLDSSYHISRSPNCRALEEKIRAHLAHLERNAPDIAEMPDFLVFPEVFMPLSMEEELKAFARRNNAIIITGIEYDAQPKEEIYGTDQARGTNRCRIYTPGAAKVAVSEYVKLTRSQYDARFERKDPDGKASQDWGSFPMDVGTKLMRFEADGIGHFGVLICYDISHFDIVHALNLGTVGKHTDPLDVLFVVAHNPYAELYRKCCLADCHRFFQYVVMCNVTQYGGSGIFAPLHTPGERRTLLHAGKNVEGIFTVEIDTSSLAKARKSTSSGKVETVRLNSDTPVRFQRKPGVLSKRLNIE